jgi:hypothetical protein
MYFFVRFFFGGAKIWPEKYDFKLYRGFFMDKMAQIRQILKIFYFFFKLQDLYDKLRIEMDFGFF